MEVNVKLRRPFNPNPDKAQEALYGGKVTPYLAGGALNKTDPKVLGRQLMDLVRRGDLNGQSALAEFAAAIANLHHR